MEDDYEPTVIMKSLKDLNTFLNRSNSSSNSRLSLGGHVPTYSSHRLSLSTSPRLKLEFSDSRCRDSSTIFEDSAEKLDGSSFLKKHRDSIAGFDIAKKIREKDGEIIEHKATISILESRIENLQTSIKMSRLQYDTELEAHRTRQFKDKELVDELQYKLKQMQSKEKELKDEFLRIQKTAENNCGHVEKKLLKMQANHLEMTERMGDELNKLRAHVNSLEKDNAEKASMLLLVESQMKDCEERERVMKKKLSNYEETYCQNENQKLQLSQAHSKIKELQNNLRELKDQELHFATFEKTIRRLPLLEKEILKLKEENNLHKITAVNVDLVKEKLESAENQIRRLESRCNELSGENGTLVELRNLSEQYEAALQKELYLEYMPPVSELMEHIKGMKSRDKEVSSTLAELKASLKSHNDTKSAQEDLMTNLKMELEKKKQDNVKSSQLVQKLQRKLVLLSKERDNLKGIVSSYESESTIRPSGLQMERIGQLETQLEGYKEEVGRLEEELQDVLKEQGLDSTMVRPKLIKKETRDQKKRIEELERRVEKLEEEKEMLELKLEHHVLKGSFDPSITKVLHFKDNPLDKANQERKEIVEKLQNENEALKKRVELLEEGDNVDLTSKVGTKVNMDVVSNKKFQEMEEKVNSLEARNNRIMEVFKRKSNEMREVVYRLTGYRVDIPKENHFKLINLYAETPDDYLMFEETAERELQLLETDFSMRFEHMIDKYLRHDQSYPAFLSAITLTMFARHSLTESPHVSSDQEEDYRAGEEEEEEEEEEEDEEEDEEVGEEYDEEEEEDYDEEEDEDNEEGRPFKRPRQETNDDEDDLICID